jgi:hypothetical protein
MKKIATLLLTFALMVCAIPVLTTPALSATAGLQGFQGSVVNSTGVPLAGVLVTARNTTTNSTLSAVSNGLGSYAMVTPAGTYNVSASFFNYQANTTYSEVVVLTGSSSELNFTMLEVLGTLHGFVTDGVAPVNGVTVVLANELRNYTSTTTSPLGEYRISGIRPGVYVATFTKIGYDRANSLPLNIFRGVTTQDNASLQAQPCTLFGKVTENGNPEDGVVITARGSDKQVVGTTDANGNYSIQLTSDSYTVTFSKKGFDPKDVSVSLAPFQHRQLDTSIVKSKNNYTATYLFGFDLSHSLMIVGLIMALATICVALFINFKVRKKPELLGQDPQEDTKKE